MHVECVCFILMSCSNWNCFQFLKRQILFAVNSLLFTCSMCCMEVYIVLPQSVIYNFPPRHILCMCMHILNTCAVYEYVHVHVYVCVICIMYMYMYIHMYLHAFIVMHTY